MVTNKLPIIVDLKNLIRMLSAGLHLQKTDHLIFDVGILIDHGYAILRIRQVDKSISMTRMNKLLEVVLSELDKINKKFPSKKKRLIEIEVQNGEAKRL